MDQKLVANLDPGIRDLVVRLNGAGFVTTDSGDGVSKPEDERVLDFPHVFCASTIATMVADADRLLPLLPKGWRVEASYSPNDGGSVIIGAYGHES